MAISLSSIKRNTGRPPKIVIYGPPGIGKTLFASKAPNPIFICAEDGLGQIDVPHFPRAQSYAEVLDAFKALYTEQHEFGTVVVDTLDSLEPMIWAHVCATVPHEKNKTIRWIEDYGYGKGFEHARKEWLTFLACCDGLNEKGMAVVLCAHSKVSTFKAPDSDDYDQYSLKINDKAESVIRGWADCLFFANYEHQIVTAGRNDERTRATGTGRRLLYTEQRPAYHAKNRYSLPPVLPLDWNAFVAAQNASAQAATASAPSPGVPAPAQ